MATHRKGPAEHRYCVVQVRMHGDEKWRRLSRPQPNAQSLWCYLLHGPRTTRLPGVVIGGRGAMACDDLKWPLEAFNDCFAELEREEMATADWDAGLVYLINAFRQEPNRPSSPSTAATWKRELANAPECLLLQRISNDLRELLKSMHPSFLRSFDRGSRRDLTRKLPAPLAGKLPSEHPSPAPALAPSPAPSPPLRGAGGMGLEGDRASKKALPARAQQTTIAEHLEAQVLPLNRALELIRDAAGGRFVISHKTRARERRNAAAEQLTLGLPQHLWDRLRAELAEETPDEALCTRLGQLLGATCARGRPILWGQWGTVTADNLVGRLHEGLTRAAAWDGMTADQPGDDRPPSRPAEEVLAEIYGQQPRAGPSGAEPLPLFDALKDPEENLGTDPAQ